MKDIGSFLSKLQRVKSAGTNQWTADCPVSSSHKTPQKHLSIGLEDDTILLTCFGSHTTEDIVKAMGLEVSDLFIKPEEKPVAVAVKEKIVAKYSYIDEEGKELFQVVRYEPKNFKQRHRNGAGEWVWNLEGVRRVLYHLPNILAAEKVYLVEGEKDADNLLGVGLAATTSPGGASNWRDEYALYLKGKQIVIIPDNDQPGLAYARSAANSLKGIASDIKCILLDDTFKDISDWLKVGRTIEELGEQAVTDLELTFIFENKGSRYIFKWGGIHCEVSRIRSGRGATSCQLVFTSGGQHLLRTKFNLESSRVRSELAKDLSTRHKDIDWKQLLEDMSTRTLEEFEKGEPVISVTSMDKTEELKYLINPIAPLGKPTFIFGDPGAGKSQLAIVITILTSLPWANNPLRLGVPDKSTKGLILDYEGDADDARRQLKSFTDGMDLGWNELYYRRCSLPLADDIEAIRTYIEDMRVDYIIVDSASMAAGGDLNHMDIATGYLRALRQLNLTSISLAHTNKNRESKEKTILGSVLFEAGARSVWEIRGQEDDDAFNIALLHRKSNLTKRSQPLGFRICYTREGNTIEWYNPKNVAEFVERMGTNQRVIELLKEESLVDKDICSALGISEVNCRVTMSRLKKKNIVSKITGKWVLVTGFRE